MRALSALGVPLALVEFVELFGALFPSHLQRSAHPGYLPLRFTPQATITKYPPLIHRNGISEPAAVVRLLDVLLDLFSQGRIVALFLVILPRY
jgi:hypothetical protein